LSSFIHLAGTLEVTSMFALLNNMTTGIQVVIASVEPEVRRTEDVFT